MTQKTVLITGASSGMGREAARLFAQKGWKVFAGARRVERMQDLVPLGIATVAMDVTNPADNARVTDRIIAEQGRIDALINNAGFGLFGPVEDIALDAARYQFEVNLFGLADLTRRVLPQMRAQGSGRIINVSSMGGRIFTPFGAWYHATKHALEGWSDCLRFELEPFGIHVSVIEPGMVGTEWGGVVRDGMQECVETSPYKTQLKPFIKLMRAYDRNPRATDPEVLAFEFYRAATDQRPRRRYVRGFSARPALFVRKWLGDGVYEAILRRGLRH